LFHSKRDYISLAVLTLPPDSDTETIAANETINNARESLPLQKSC